MVSSFKVRESPPSSIGGLIPSFSEDPGPAFERVDRVATVGISRRSFLAKVFGFGVALGLMSLRLFRPGEAWAAPPSNYTCDIGWPWIYTNGSAGPCASGGYSEDTDCTGCGPSTTSSGYCKSGSGLYRNHKNCKDWSEIYDTQYYDRTDECFENKYDGWYWDVASSNGCGCGSGRKMRFRCPDGWTSWNQGANWTKTICRTSQCL